jgi:hypothetical protein
MVGGCQAETEFAVNPVKGTYLLELSGKEILRVKEGLNIFRLSCMNHLTRTSHEHSILLTSLRSSIIASRLSVLT